MLTVLVMIVLQWGGFMRTILGIVLIAAVSFGVAMAEDCPPLSRQTSLPLTLDASGRVNVPIVVNGHDLTVTVDTGAYYSMLSQNTVDQLGLQVGKMPASMMAIFGGIQLKQVAVADDVKIGRLQGGKSEFVVAPDKLFHSSVNGLLGAAILGAFDADFDFAGGKLNLVSQKHCDGTVVYWTKSAPFAVIPFDTNTFAAMLQKSKHPKIVVHVQLDGKDVTAIVDTGSSRSNLSLETAETLFGLSESSLTPVRGSVNNTINKIYFQKFKQLGFGSIEINNPSFMLISDTDSKLPAAAPKMLIGMDILRHLHLYIAYREQKLYVTDASAN
jgi:predicted aspartyl protease